VFNTCDCSVPDSNLGSFLQDRGTISFSPSAEIKPVRQKLFNSSRFSIKFLTSQHLVILSTSLRTSRNPKTLVNCATAKPLDRQPYLNLPHLSRSAPRLTPALGLELAVAYCPYRRIVADHTPATLRQRAYRCKAWYCACFCDSRYFVAQRESYILAAAKTARYLSALVSLPRLPACPIGTSCAGPMANMVT